MRLSSYAFLTVAVASLSLSQNVAFAFSWKSLFGSEEEDTANNNNPRRDLIEEFGEEGYKKRLADAFGEDYDETKTDEIEAPTVEYGVDLSYPIHRYKASTNFDSLPHNVDPENNPEPSEHKGLPVQILGDKQTFYEESMQGCREHYSKSPMSCDSTERDRINMNLRQPQSMQNYTDIGFKKIRAPAELMKLLSDFYQDSSHMATPEKWAIGNTYTNHWKSPTLMLSVEDASIPNGGHKLKQKIWDAARSTLEEWTGEYLTPCSLYGIRIYKEGAVLAPHVDRLPLVASAIINVAQDVDVDWPIEVYAHDGKAYNVTMKPGDMVLYESHSVIHGRPFPLQGRYYANVFIHFEPIGHSLRHEDKLAGGDAEEQYMKAREMKRADGATMDDLPPYIKKGTPEEKRWRQKNALGVQEELGTGTNTPHTIAAQGRLGDLAKIAKKDKELLHQPDENGWIPLHEAVRSGHVDVVKFLVEQGSDINARTNGGKGGSAFWWARKSHDEDHPMITYMKGVGAAEIEPEL